MEKSPYCELKLLSKCGIQMCICQFQMHALIFHVGSKQCQILNPESRAACLKAISAIFGLHYFSVWVHRSRGLAEQRPLRNGTLKSSCKTLRHYSIWFLSIGPFSILFCCIILQVSGSISQSILCILGTGLSTVIHVIQPYKLLLWATNLKKKQMDGQK